MSSPIIEVFMFEAVLHAAVSAHLIANGINDPKAQQGEDYLKTPRVEMKTVLGPWGPTADKPHLWLLGALCEPDCRDGTLYLKIVTRRGDDTQDHYRLVGTVRVLLQERAVLTNRMDLHAINRIVEGGTVPDFNQDEHHDVTTLSFLFRMSILYATRTADIFPT